MFYSMIKFCQKQAVTLTLLLGMVCCMALWNNPIVFAEEQQAHKPHGDHIYVHHGWLRKPIGALKTTAAYMMIGNPTKEDDFLLSATSSFATNIEVHETIREDDILRMSPVARLKISAKAYTKFKQGSYHLMVTGIQKDLKVGDSVIIKLVFEKAGTKDVAFKILDGAPRGSHGETQTKEGTHRGSH